MLHLLLFTNIGLWRLEEVPTRPAIDGFLTHTLLWIVNCKSQRFQYWILLLMESKPV